MTVLTAHQPMYAPWLGLIAKIAAADLFVSFDGVSFERHGYGNRNRIRTQAGVQWLTVPVALSNHLDKPIHQIEIVPGPWRRKHLRTLALSYAKAPHFDRYFPTFKGIYERDWQYLAGLNQALLIWILAELDIKTPIISASEHGFEGSKSALVLDMCRKLGASEYIFGAQGRDYADVPAFEAAGINVTFQDYRHPTYPQIHGGFEPFMSVLDLLFNCGPDSSAIIGGLNGSE